MAWMMAWAVAVSGTVASVVMSPLPMSSCSQAARDWSRFCMFMV
ncbi:hypothetical protein [Selenomonas sp. GACV-9]